MKLTPNRCLSRFDTVRSRVLQLSEHLHSGGLIRKFSFSVETKQGPDMEDNVLMSSM